MPNQNPNVLTIAMNLNGQNIPVRREKPFILNNSNWTQHKHLVTSSSFHPQTSSSLATQTAEQLLG